MGSLRVMTRPASVAIGNFLGGMPVAHGRSWIGVLVDSGVVPVGMATCGWALLEDSVAHQWLMANQGSW